MFTSFLKPLRFLAFPLVSFFWLTGGAPADAQPLVSESLKPLLDARLEEGNFDCELDLGDIEKQVCLIYQSAVWAAGDSESLAFRRSYALQATNVVSNLVAYARHHLIQQVIGRFPESPGADVELCLDRRHGLCGNQATTFVALLQSIGIPARRVQFYFRDASGERRGHMAAEVEIDGWRYFETTWGVVFLKDENDPRSLASVQEILDGVPVTHVANNAQTWSYYNLGHEDTLRYLRSDPSVVVGVDSGVVHFDDIDLSSGTVSLDRRPTSVGDRNADGPFEGVEYEFHGLLGEGVLHFDVARIGACRTGGAQLCVDDSCQEAKKGVLSFEKADPVRVRVVSPSDEHCFVVFHGVTFEGFGS